MALPSIKQAASARGALTAASEMAIIVDAIATYEPGTELEICRAGLMNHLRTAARILGYRLEPIAALAVDNDASETTIYNSGR